MITIEMKATETELKEIEDLVKVQFGKVVTTEYNNGHLLVDHYTDHICAKETDDVFIPIAYFIEGMLAIMNHRK